MPIYRVQATHVDYWRGSPHRWHSTLHYQCSTDALMGGTIPDLYTKLSNLGSSAKPGGLAQISVYNTVTRGTAIAEQVYFPWGTPGSWIPYPHNYWSPTDTIPPLSGENCARFRTQAGTSKTGKPVFVGLYWRSFEASAPEGSSVQFPPAVVAIMSPYYNALQALQNAGTAVAVQVTPSGASIAGTGTLEPYVMNHQRTRGRRKSTKALVAELQARAGQTSGTNGAIEPRLPVQGG